MPERRAFNGFGLLLHIIDAMDQHPRGWPGHRPSGARGPAAVSQATYWRRRVMVLAIGIGLLCTVGWTVNGVLTDSSSAGQATPPKAAGTTGSAPAPSSPPAPTHSPAPPSPSPSPTPSRHHSAVPAQASGRAAACAPATVTLRLSTPQSWYQSGTTPRFTVRAVATGSQPCRFNMGTRFVSVIVAAGNRPLWSSADCPQGRGSRPAVLTTDRPGVLHVSWDRRTSSPGCAGSQRLVRPGEYQVTAVAGRLHSSTVNVVLGAKGASGP